MQKFQILKASNLIVIYNRWYNIKLIKLHFYGKLKLSFLVESIFNTLQFYIDFEFY